MENFDKLMVRYVPLGSTVNKYNVFDFPLVWRGDYISKDKSVLIEVTSEGCIMRSNYISEEETLEFLKEFGSFRLKGSIEELMEMYNKKYVE